MAEMSWFEFILASLATWRLSVLLVRENGPWDVLRRLRERSGPSVIGRALQCVLCTSLWISVLAAIWLEGWTWRWPLAWLGVAGAAAALDGVTWRDSSHEPLTLEQAEEVERGGT